MILLLADDVISTAILRHTTIPSHFRVIDSSGFILFVLNSIWCPVNERKRSAAAAGARELLPLFIGSISSAITSNVSQQNNISADSFPVLNFDLSSSIIAFDDQIVGDVWSSFMDTTWRENKSFKKIMSPPSSRRNLTPHKPRSSECKSRDSVIWK